MVKQGALLPRLWAWTWRGVCRHVCALYAFVCIPECMSFSKTSSQALLLTTKRYLPPLGPGFRGAGAWSPAANPDASHSFSSPNLWPCLLYIRRTMLPRKQGPLHPTAAFLTLGPVTGLLPSRARQDWPHTQVHHCLARLCLRRRLLGICHVFHAPRGSTRGQEAR